MNNSRVVCVSAKIFAQLCSSVSTHSLEVEAKRTRMNKRLNYPSAPSSNAATPEKDPMRGERARKGGWVVLLPERAGQDCDSALDAVGQQMLV